MSGLENREKLAESFNELLQVLDKESIKFLFKDRNFKGNEDKFLYLQYTDVDEFTLCYDDEFGDGLNVELFKISVEEFLFKGVILSSLVIFLEDEIKKEETFLKVVSKFIDLATIEIERLKSNGVLEEMLLEQKKQGVN